MADGSAHEKIVKVHISNQDAEAVTANDVIAAIQTELTRIQGNLGAGPLFANSQEKLVIMTEVGFPLTRPKSGKS